MNKRIKGRPKHETPKRELAALKSDHEEESVFKGKLPAHEEGQIHRPYKEEGGHSRRAS